MRPLRTLEEKGLVKPSNQGATTTEQTSAFVDTHAGKLDAISEALDEIKADGAPETDSNQRRVR
jgi:predicted transcriptional regulator